MPSPFPGMDPYLEGEEWPNFHGQFAVQIAHQLTPLLRPRYFAKIEKRHIADSLDGLEIDEKAFIPDVSVQRRPSHTSASRTATIVPAPLELPSALPIDAPWYSIEIHTTSNRNLVAMIELLSPANKQGKGREEYIEKRERIMLSNVHLLEIDLCRVGQRIPLRKALPEHPYFVFLTRGNRRSVTEIWPVSLSEPLPTVAVPLVSPDPDVPLDLQRGLSTMYDDGGFDIGIDYSAPPPVRLTAEETDLVRECLAGLNQV